MHGIGVVLFLIGIYMVCGFNDDPMKFMKFIGVLVTIIIALAVAAFAISNAPTDKDFQAFPAFCVALVLFFAVWFCRRGKSEVRYAPARTATGEGFAWVGVITCFGLGLAGLVLFLL